MSSDYGINEEGGMKVKNEGGWSYRAAVIILSLILAGIPLMWILGHRGNNFLLLYFVMFAVMLHFSEAFSRQVGIAVENAARNRSHTKRLIGLLAMTAILLTVASLLTNETIHFWDLDREDGLGTLFSGVLFATNLLIISYCALHAEKGTSRRRWIMLALLFGAMALDEISEYHHWLVYDIWETLSGLGQTRLIESVALWVTVALPLIAGVIILLVRFIFLDLSKTSRKAAILGLFFWIIALVNEAVTPGSNMPHALQVASEEFCEMMGTILFLAGFLVEYRVILKRDSQPKEHHELQVNTSA